MTGVLAASVVVAVSVPLTRLVHYALILRFLAKQLEDADSSARLEVSLVLARQMRTVESSVTPAVQKQTASMTCAGPLTQVEAAVRSHRR